jgi:hypothetical protein
MPLIRGKTRGLNYYSFGKHGHKYFYDPGNKQSRDKAKLDALKQGRAIEIHKKIQSK